MRQLMKYHWPGNVRELENLIERAVVTTRGSMLSEDDFPTDMVLGELADSAFGLQVPMKLEEGNKYLILKTLEKFNGNKTRAAEALGITPRTIRNKLAEYQLERI
jgi:DNA-binding NtrC family response regulator